MEYGWEKLPRCFLRTKSSGKMIPTGVYTHCLLRANHMDTVYKGIPLKAGQFLTSVEKFASECNISAKQMRLALNQLQNDGLIKVERARKGTKSGTVITVDNYGDSDGRWTMEGKEKGKEEGCEGKEMGKEMASNRAKSKPPGCIEKTILPESCSIGNGQATRQITGQATGQQSKTKNKDIDIKLQQQHYSQKDLDAILNLMRKSGFSINVMVKKSVTDLLAEYGKQELIESIDDSAEHGAKTLVYLKKVLEGRRSRKRSVNLSLVDSSDYILEPSELSEAAKAAIENFRRGLMNEQQTERK